MGLKRDRNGAEIGLKLGINFGFGGQVLYSLTSHVDMNVQYQWLPLA